jgi:hypothetical protein
MMISTLSFLLLNSFCDAMISLIDQYWYLSKISLLQSSRLTKKWIILFVMNRNFESWIKQSLFIMDYFACTRFHHLCLFLANLLKFSLFCTSTLIDLWILSSAPWLVLFHFFESTGFRYDLSHQWMVIFYSFWNFATISYLCIFFFEIPLFVMY